MSAVEKLSNDVDAVAVAKRTEHFTFVMLFYAVDVYCVLLSVFSPFFSLALSLRLMFVSIVDETLNKLSRQIPVQVYLHSLN